MSRYHPALVALHWIMAIMILLALFFGKTILPSLDKADPATLGAFAGHMTIGLAVGALLVLRVLIRLLSQTPPHAATGNGLLDRLGKLSHWGFYVLIAGMVLSGMATSLVNGLPAIVFEGSGDPIPANMNETAPRIVHGILSNLLLALVALHFVAALYHQFFLKDGLFRRMWFGRRTPSA